MAEPPRTMTFYQASEAPAASGDPSGNMRRAMTFAGHRGSVGSSGNGFGSQTTTDTFGGDMVDVVCDGDSSSGSDSEVESPRNGGGPKSRPFPRPDERSADEIAQELDHELHNAVATGECNLSKLELTEIPPSANFELALPTLQVLSLSENKFFRLDEVLICRMPSLVRLNLSNNQLTTLPRCVFQLPALEELLVDHNSIQEIPIGDDTTCTSLRIFGIEWNDIEDFPMELVVRCPHLQELWLGENERLTKIPTGEVLANFPKAALKVKFDNRPLLQQKVISNNWATLAPWIDVVWNKIYPDKVLDFLFLGSLRTAQCLDVYRDLNIGFVLTAGRHLDVKLFPGMLHLVLPVDDLPGEDMTPLFEQAFAFIDQAKAANKGILIHCFAGLSRSVTITVAYLMNKMYPLTRDEALALVRQSRPAAQPNAGFLKNLLAYEMRLRTERN